MAAQQAIMKHTSEEQRFTHMDIHCFNTVTTATGDAEVGLVMQYTHI